VLHCRTHPADAKAAPRYPLIVVIGIAVAVVTTVVIPYFAPLFEVLGDHDPLPTRILIGTPAFVRGPSVVLPCGILMAIVRIRRRRATEPAATAATGPSGGCGRSGSSFPQRSCRA
jgi:type II secretory pathway component PulF